MDFMQHRQFSCRLTYMDIPMGKQMMTYGLQKHLPYKKDINSAILR